MYSSLCWHKSLMNYQNKRRRNVINGMMSLPSHLSRISNESLLHRLSCECRDSLNWAETGLDWTTELEWCELRNCGETGTPAVRQAVTHSDQIWVCKWTSGWMESRSLEDAVEDKTTSWGKRTNDVVYVLFKHTEWNDWWLQEHDINTMLRLSWGDSILRLLQENEDKNSKSVQTMWIIPYMFP